MKKVSVLILSVFLIGQVFSQTAPAITFNQVASGLSNPIDVVNCGDARLFIAEKSGKVKIFQNGAIQATPLIDVASLINGNGEYGLLSIVFHPNYLTNGYLYCYYIRNTSGVSIEIRRFTAASPATNTAINLNTGTTIVVLTPLDGSSLHNGGKMNFGPDGNLYVGTGDGSQGQDPSNNAQNATNRFGKMLKIDVNTSGFPLTIYNKGLRNPWRWSFDRLNGDMWIADVGEGAWEEVNYTPFVGSQDLNYAWRCYEGTHEYNTSGCQPQSSYQMPMHEYDHSFGSSITGGYVYRGSEYPSLSGWYICADFIKSGAWLMKPNGSGGWLKTSQTTGIPNLIVGFGESNTGELYALKYTGILYKISAPPVVPITLESFSGKAYNGYNQLIWKVATEQNISYYEIEVSNNGIIFSTVGVQSAFNISPITYIYNHSVIGYWPETYYRLKIVDKDRVITYSPVIVLNWSTIGVRVYPTVISDNVTIYSSEKIESVSIYSLDGKILFTRMLNQSGTISIPIPYLSSGIYMLGLRTGFQVITKRIMVRN